MNYHRVTLTNISGTTGNPSNTGTNSQTVTISGNTGSTGSGSSIENRPPYYALMLYHENLKCSWVDKNTYIC